MKTFPGGKLGDGAGFPLSGADVWKCLEMLAHKLKIQIGAKRIQPHLVELHARSKKIPLEAEENYAGIDKLLAVNPWDDSNRGVVK
jgi:hypothetical protein